MENSSSIENTFVQNTSGHGYPSTRKGWVLRGLRDGFPICMGYFAVAFALGIEARRVGLSAFQSFLMSTGMVASAGEFAALMLIESHAGVIEMISTCIIVNLRYFLMSCSLSQKLKSSLPSIHRFGVAYCITDEIFGLSSAVPGYLEPLYSYAITFISVAGWSGGTVMGVLVGNILPASAVNALSVSLYGMFLAIIIPPAKENRFIGGLPSAHNGHFLRFQGHYPDHPARRRGCSDQAHRCRKRNMRLQL